MDAVVGAYSVQVYAAGRWPSILVAAVPAHPLQAGAVVAVGEHAHPLAVDIIDGESLTGLTAIDTVVAPMPPPWPSDTVNVKLSVALSSPLWR